MVHKAFDRNQGTTQTSLKTGVNSGVLEG